MLKEKVKEEFKKKTIRENNEKRGKENKSELRA